MSNLKELYNKNIIPELKKKLGYSNDFEVPRIEKIVINSGINSSTKDKKVIDNVIESIKKITGQSPVKTYSRKAISGFGIRENQVVGLKVTLRGDRMYEFLDKMVNSALPRIRDFRGLPIKGFDRQGNYSIGLREQISFPEVKTDEVDNVHGLEVCVKVKAKNAEESKELLKLLGFPFNTSAGSALK